MRDRSNYATLGRYFCVIDRTAQLAADSILIVAANRCVITELAGGLSERWLDRKMAHSHAIDELPNFPAHLATNSLPFDVIQLGLRARHARVLSEGRTV